MKDWTGNANSVFTTLGARNYAHEEREQHDYYATEPKAGKLLLEVESFSPNIWECACGEGHLSEVFKAAGYNVYSSDLIDRGYGVQRDFLLTSTPPMGNCDIITNPPYSKAVEFADHALDIVADGHKVAMFLKIQFLEGKARRKFFDRRPPKRIYVSSSRLHCAMNGDFERYAKSNAMCYAWYVWEKGFKGNPTIHWIN